MFDHGQKLALQTLAHSIRGCVEAFGPACTAQLLGTVAVDLIEADQHAAKPSSRGPTLTNREDVNSRLAFDSVTSAPARDTAGPTDTRRRRNDEWLNEVAVRGPGVVGIGLSVVADLPQTTHLAKEHCPASSIRAWRMWLASSLLIRCLALYRDRYRGMGCSTHPTNIHRPASSTIGLPPRHRPGGTTMIPHTTTKNMSPLANGNGHSPGRRRSLTPPDLRLDGAGTTPSIDLAAAERAVTDLLTALGEDLEDDHVRDTPRRVAAAYAEILTPRAFNPTTFPNDEGYNELVLARDIPFHSLCQHHMLPFKGTAHVGYLPGRRILGLSKLARVVEHFSRSLQVQERLTQQVADWLHDQLAPKGVGVVLDAEHMCMTLRGVEASGSRTITSALHGLLRDDERTRAEFFALVG